MLAPSVRSLWNNAPSAAHCLPRRERQEVATRNRIRVLFVAPFAARNTTVSADASMCCASVESCGLLTQAPADQIRAAQSAEGWHIPSVIKYVVARGKVAIPSFVKSAERLSLCRATSVIESSAAYA